MGFRSGQPHRVDTTVQADKTVLMELGQLDDKALQSAVRGHRYRELVGIPQWIQWCDLYLMKINTLVPLTGDEKRPKMEMIKN